MKRESDSSSLHVNLNATLGHNLVVWFRFAVLIDFKPIHATDVQLPAGGTLISLLTFGSLFYATRTTCERRSVSCISEIRSVTRSNFYLERGQTAKCTTNGNLFMAMFGAAQIVLSQLPNMEKITWLSVMAATMSFAYSIISLCLCLFKWFSNHGDMEGTSFGSIASHAAGLSALKTWNAFQAL